MAASETDSVDREKEGDVVDGEHPIRAVSGPPDDNVSRRGAAGASSEGKRRRVENAPTAPPTPVASPTTAFRGRNFFLNHNTQQQVGSTLQDIHSLQRQQQANMSALAEANAPHQTEGEADSGRRDDDAMARKTPHHGPSSGVASEGLPPTTPYGHMILPTWVVEQRNDTAIRELRQVMGAYNPNSARLSTGGGKRTRIHGSGGGEAEGCSGNSAAWWAEMSSAPMPNYAADPQYSMELF